MIRTPGLVDISPCGRCDACIAGPPVHCHSHLRVACVYMYDVCVRCEYHVVPIFLLLLFMFTVVVYVCTNHIDMHAAAWGLAHVDHGSQRVQHPELFEPFFV